MEEVQEHILYFINADQFIIAYMLQVQFPKQVLKEIKMHHEL